MRYSRTNWLALFIFRQIEASVVISARTMIFSDVLISIASVLRCFLSTTLLLSVFIYHDSLRDFLPHSITTTTNQQQQHRARPHHGRAPKPSSIEPCCRRQLANCSPPRAPVCLKLQSQASRQHRRTFLLTCSQRSSQSRHSTRNTTAQLKTRSILRSRPNSRSCQF